MTSAAASGSGSRPGVDQVKTEAHGPETPKRKGGRNAEASSSAAFSPRTYARELEEIDQLVENARQAQRSNEPFKRLLILVPFIVKASSTTVKHVFCAKATWAPSNLGVQAAMVRCYAFTPTMELDEWLDIQSRSFLNCEACFDGYLRSRKLANDKFLNELPPNRVKQFQDHIDNWTYDMLSRLLKERGISSSDDLIRLSPSEMYAFLHFAVVRFVTQVGTSPAPQHARKAEEEAKQAALLSLLNGLSPTKKLHNVQRLSPALLLLLAGHSGASLRSWAAFQLCADDGLAIDTEGLQNPVYPSTARQIQSALSSDDLTVDARAHIWSALRHILRSDKVAPLSDQLMNIVLAHLQDDGSHAYDVLGCFERILSLSGPKMFAAQDDLADFTMTMLSRVTDSPAILRLLAKTTIATETKRKDLLGWMHVFFTLFLTNARRPLSEVAFRDCLKSIMHWCFERTQGLDTSPDVADLLLREGLRLLSTITDRLYPHRSREFKISVRRLDAEINQPADAATAAQRASEAVTDAQKSRYREVLSDTLEFHAKSIVGVASRARLEAGVKGSKDARRDADTTPELAVSLVQSVLNHDATSVSDMIFRLSDHTRHYRNEMAKDKPEKWKPLYKNAQLTLLDWVPVCAGLWRSIYQAVKDSGRIALVALQANLPLTIFRLVDNEDLLKTHMLPPPAVDKSGPDKSGAKDSEYQKYVRKLRTMIDAYDSHMMDTRWGVFAAVRELLDNDEGSERDNLLRRLCTEHTDVIIMLAHSAAPPIRNSALSCARQVFEDSHTREDCLRVLLQANPKSAIEGLNSFLKLFERAAAKLIEASQAAAYMVRSFADIMSVLCGPNGMLREGSSFSIKERRQLCSDVAKPLATLWKHMCGSMEVIYDRTPAWSKILSRQELLAWFRDVNLFATDMLDNVNVVEEAIDSVKPDTAPRADLVAEFSRPVIAAFQWLRLNDTETLHSSFEFVHRAVERVMNSPAVLGGNSDIQKGLLAKLESIEGKAKDGRVKSLISKDQMASLRVLILGEEEAARRAEMLQDSEDEVEFVDIKPTLASVRATSDADAKSRSRSHQGTASGSNKVKMRQSSIVASMARATEIQTDAPPRPKAGVAPSTASSGSRNAYQSASSSATKRDDRVTLAAKNSSMAKLKAAHKSSLPKFNKRPPVAVAPAARSSVTGALDRRDLASADPRPPQGSRVGDEVQDDDDESSPEKPKRHSLHALQESAEEIRMRQLNAIENMKRKRAEERGTKLRVDPNIAAERQRKMEEMRKHKLQAAANFNQLHEVILGWSAAPSGDTPPNFDVDTLRRVPQTFKDAQEYLAAFEPFFILDTWASFCQAREDLQVYTSTPLLVTITSRSSINRFTELVATCQVTDPKLIRLSDTDIVLVGAEQGPRSVLAKVQEVRREGINYAITLRLSLKSDPQQISAELAPGSRWKMQRFFSLSTTHRAYEALMKVQHFKLRDDVLRAQPWQAQSVPYWDVEKVLRKMDVNEPQATAIVHALASQGFSLIQGPPGTGKTKTICGLLQQSFNLGSTRAKRPKIFICAPSNAAIDEVARRAKALNIPGEGKLAVVRVGRTEKISSAVADITLDAMVDARMAVSDESAMLKDSSALHAKNQQLRDEINDLRKKIKDAEMSGKGKDELTELHKRRREKESQRQVTLQNLDEVKDKQKDTRRQQDADRIKFRRQILDSADVICSTLSGAGQDSFGNMEFETVIIDEAAQAVELETLIPLRFDCQRCILVGDQNQLPPTVLSTVAKKYGYAKSLFVRLFENFPERVHLLSIQYRMHPEISILPSATFYQSRLTDGPGMEKQTAQPWHDDPLLGPFKFFSCKGREMKGRSHSLKNPLEVDVALAIYNRLRVLWGADLDYRVGIISPYKDQVSELRFAFESRFAKDISNRIDFNTVDGFQGQEKDIIIFSCVRSGETSARNAVGFLRDPRRANVALTRAKSNLFIVGNAPFLRSDPVWGFIVWHAEKRKLLHDVRDAVFSTPVARLPRELPAPREGWGQEPKQSELYEALRGAGMLARRQTELEHDRAMQSYHRRASTANARQASPDVKRREGAGSAGNDGAEPEEPDPYWAPKDRTAAAALRRNLGTGASGADSDGDSIWGDGSDDGAEPMSDVRRDANASSNGPAGGKGSTLVAGQKRPAPENDGSTELNGAGRAEKAARTSSSSASAPSDGRRTNGQSSSAAQAAAARRGPVKTTVVFSNAQAPASRVAVARPVTVARPAGPAANRANDVSGAVVPSAGALSALFVKKRRP